MVCSTNCSMLLAPMLASMAAMSLALGPMWRLMKSSRCPSAASVGARERLSMGGRSWA